jgi:hypothetical protein
MLLYNVMSCNATKIFRHLDCIQSEEPADTVQFKSHGLFNTTCTPRTELVNIDVLKTHTKSHVARAVHKLDRKETVSVANWMC